MSANRSNQELIIAGLFRLAWSFPFIFMGPSLYIGKGTSGAWYWTAISIAIMLIAVVLAVSGLRKVMSGFFDGK
ncbi:MAG: hypothetical protein CMP53_04420 [Flavobacteriales bacterium]|jgi:hypothetical protein|nr:hypothetical protein [Flavobacteriales bacterium]|tara:strand:- start:454 stop:675 length:222 start_codon:yes stop_codon:yes gene_type:complete